MVELRTLHVYIRDGDEEMFKEFRRLAKKDKKTKEIKSKDKGGNSSPVSLTITRLVKLYVKKLNPQFFENESIDANSSEE